MDEVLGCVRTVQCQLSHACQRWVLAVCATLIFAVQVAIADVDRDGQLEMLLADSSGTVACVRHDGTECWRTRVEGAQRDPGVL